MHTPSASVICDSIGEHSPRLITFMTSYWKAVHAEHMRHRTGSYCVSSSRAIPVSRNLEIVRSDELRAGPIFWGAEQKGMSPGGELSDEVSEGAIFSLRKKARDAWTIAAHNAAQVAEHMVRLGVHKSIVNRLLDPFLPVNVLVTSCESGLLNFFGLRLDKAADPTIRALAEAMWVAWNESKPQKLEPEQWHLPFADGERTFDEVFAARDGIGDLTETLLKVSVARCARLSYMSYETQKRSTVEEDLALYERLVGAHPIHASPAEHQATPDVVIGKKLVWKEHPITYDKITGYPVINHEDLLWKGQLEEVDAYRNEDLHGNLPGWIQYRKTLPGEAVAPLPEGYAH